MASAWAFPAQVKPRRVLVGGNNAGYQGPKPILAKRVERSQCVGFTASEGSRTVASVLTAPVKPEAEEEGSAAQRVQ